MKAGGVTLTVSSLKKKAEHGSLKPGAGETLLVADVTIENHGSDKPVAFGPRQFRLTDADSREYMASQKSFAGALLPGDLKKGAKTRGDLVLLTRSTTGLVLRYKPAGTAKELTIKLTK